MRRPAGAIRQVAVRGSHHVSVTCFGAADSLVEVFCLEPERYAVAVRSRRRVPDSAVVVFDLEAT
jgi:hypothetical protein